MQVRLTAYMESPWLSRTELCKYKNHNIFFAVEVQRALSSFSPRLHERVSDGGDIVACNENT